MKRKILLTLAAILSLALLPSCDWEDTLAWDRHNGWSEGTTNHLLVEIHGPEANTHPDAVAARERVAQAAASRSDVWWALAGCETGQKYNNPNTGNGYYGFFQFDLQTWQSVGGPGYPHHHNYETQKHYAQKLQAQRGWGPWPHCSRKLGLR